MRIDRVKDVIEHAADGANVTLKGNIIRQLSHELYLFSDPGGILAIEIDDSFERPGRINEETLIEVSGWVERDEGRVELEVTQVRILDASP
jgi:uncharacterized protein (TIGR00156 family)